MKNELTYTKVGDYSLPNLTLQNPESQPLGRYGRMRRDYLKNHRPILYNRLILSEKLFSHLTEIEETANRRMEQMMDELTKANGLTEQMKSENPMLWVQTMNNLKSQAEETILTELIYS
ncbi:MAG: TnpV protein [Clostridia bacterium]|nr:TnpV protein [Clostridia bacterium]